IANMFQVPLAIGIKTFAPASFWTMTGANPADYVDLNLIDFLTNNLLPVTLGNIIGGGIFVGMWYWLIYLRD
ncbi:formate/nitrite transporter family protein, partial [Vibrio sp. 10N.222.55.E8]